MEYDVSIIVPGIRTENWESLCDSIGRSTKSLATEIIFCGPKTGPDKVMSRHNVKFIEDWGNPNRATQVALLHAEGDYILLESDDGVMMDGSLDHIFEILDSIGPRSPYNMVVGKYLEGAGTGMKDDWYYYINNHDMSAQAELGIEDDWLTACQLLIDREHFLEVFGGYNMIFETGAMAALELAVRIQRLHKYKLRLTKVPVSVHTHLQGAAGDHGPIEFATTQHDRHLYRSYIPTIDDSKTKMDINAWTKVPAIWERRFAGTNKSYKYVETEKYGRKIMECIYE